ncbi:MAG TPA: hypothetical protein VFF49_11210 [Thermodesulfobacteriota bacterium]|nr:hypothetical protein [Thermodesulfobacteriota bacterium]
MLVSEESLEIYSEATKLAMKNNQVVGKNNDYYITLEQLEEIIKRANNIISSNKRI